MFLVCHVINAKVPYGSILCPTLFLLCINDLPDVICNIAIYADNSVLYSKCDQASVRHWTGVESGLFRLTGLITLMLLI